MYSQLTAIIGISNENTQVLQNCTWIGNLSKYELKCTICMEEPLIFEIMSFQSAIRPFPKIIYRGWLWVWTKPNVTKHPEKPFFHFFLTICTSRFCLRNLDQEHEEDYLLSRVEQRGRRSDNASYSAITCSLPPELMPAGQEVF